MNKQELRDLVKHEKLDRFVNNDQEYYTLSSQMVNNVLHFPLHHTAKTVGLFASKKASLEIHTDSLFAKCIAEGKIVYFPRCMVETHDLEFTRIIDLQEELEIGTFSLREPKKTLNRENQDTVMKKLDIIYVPGVAFDLYGNRLGFGSGYYDTFLKKLGTHHHNPPIIGLAFDFQVFSKEIPHNAKDEKVDYIITPTSIIKTYNN
ncbi:MAG: 5-formyltetrahydrofolate cyclo-ligase [Candidatus Lokiarchaeota archaeon]|nr:5-formyltetrahydrofolate cyclo-ligase [Candidatus Lokiarchaeota archaeon]